MKTPCCRATKGGKIPAMENKTKRQVAYLLSKVSPISEPQKKKMLKELHSGVVKVKK
jgi:hypothetical protein